MRDFIVDYRWSSDEIKTMIAKRISSYYHKYCDNDIVTKDDDWYIGLLFDLTTDFDLSDKNVEKRKQNNITAYVRRFGTQRISLFTRLAYHIGISRC